MKIEKLVIYGFGKHQDRTITVDPEMSIFYGANEAGKTTIQQFIIQTLFGYPSRNQNMQRYEPKSGGKYGGQLHINDDVFGRVIIERVKGKSAGDVTVYFEDGTRGTDAELKMILRDYDRASFESIFSFSIHELQGLERMTENELSRTLLASGTTGVDAITKLESRLEKEMAAVFKKSGRNPEINQIIEELKKIESELKEYRSRTELYGPYLSRLQAIEQRLHEMNDVEKKLSGQLKSLEKWQQAAPLMDKKDSLERKINEIAIFDFPSDGRRRMDRLSDRLSEVKAKVDYTEKEMTGMAGQAEGPADTEELEQMLARESEWLQLRSVLRQKKEEALKLVDEQQRILALIGMTEEDALQADVSLSQEELLLEHIKKADLEEEEKRYRDRKLTEEKNKLAEAEKELKYFLSAEPTEEERELAEEWMAAQPKLAQAKAAQQLQQSGNSPTLFYLLMALGILGITAGLVQTNVLMAALGILAAAGGIWFRLTNKKPDSLSKEYTKLLERYFGKEAELEALMQKLDRFDRKLDNLLENVDTAKRRVTDLYREAATQTAKEAYGTFLQQLGLNPGTNRNTVLSLFENLRQAHAFHSRAQRINEEGAALSQQLQAWLEQASEIYGKPLTAENLYAVLRSELNLRKQKLEEHIKEQEKNAELQENLEQLSALSEQIQKEQQHLLTEAGTQTVEEFYRFCDEWERKAELERELAPIESQLKAFGDFVVPDGLDHTNAESHVAESEAALQKLKEERNVLLAEQAEKRQTTKSLLEDEAYEDKLQQFEEKKEELAELARRWSIDKAIIAAIKQTMEELKEKKLPAVITSAQSYFKKLTSGAYNGLEMNPQGFFEAVRSDGMRFHIAELSQATKEQAYISLRLSLAVSMQSSHPFPLIMDDAFVHFDRSRLQQMINLITELQANHQFIYFTCHEAMPETWPNASVIDVATIERSVQI
ncbi:AAA family ATPase [Planococcus shenhongbingii]|uniref:ATP-binding protein n=1 Tax=Planococcus shenhongbingii TaxID=3058398 RepID=UPI00262F086A|nr:AAA family ATPase [Planococcus sp. N016]WKA59643.1 AAA family ATPase [Planococcus sp. N016]